MFQDSLLEIEADYFEPEFSEDEVAASICKDSFFEFVKEFWGEIISDKPVWNWHIPYLCDELQIVADWVINDQEKEYDLIINVPPGTTKSTLCSIMLQAYIWTRMPSARFITASHAFTLATEMARRSRDVVLSKRYQQYFPGLELRDDQNTKALFVNNYGGLRLSTGTGGSAIGHHAHLITIDDPIDPQAVLSDAELAEVNRFINETLSGRKVDKRKTPTILIMQRLHQYDPTGDKLSQGGKIKHICLPAEESEFIRPDSARKHYVNGLLDPERLNQTVLDDALRSLGQYGYAGQYEQTPIPAGGGMFQTDKITVDIPPEKFKKVIRFWDKAASKTRGSAFSVGVKMGIDFDNYIWILDVKRARLHSHERERRIRRTAKLDRKKTIVGLEQEPGSGGKDSAMSTVRSLHGYRVRVVRPKGDKVVRADTFSVQVNEGNVFMKKGHWNDEYIEELKYFPNSKYKDQVDASSGAYTELTTAKRRAGAL